MFGIKARAYFAAPLRIDALLEAELLILTFSIGIQDAIAFPDFKCFASNQTGNTVVLAIGAAGLGGEQFDLRNIGISLSAFIAGATLTGQFANIIGSSRRGWLLASHLIQTLMVFAAAAIQLISNGQGTGSYAMGSITLLAFSSGAQVASMRPMRVQEITTAMATAAWVDFVIDPQLLSASNRPRNRRGLFLLTLIVGSFVGAFMYRGVGSGNTLMLSAALKLTVTLMLLLNAQHSEMNAT